MRFWLNNRLVRPNYPQDIKLVTKMQSGERYYRTELDTDLTFTDQYGDYSWIMSQPFDTRFILHLEHGSTTWNGVFYMTDCTIDHARRTIRVKPDVYDVYSDIIDGMDKEIDVVKLAPAVVQCGMKKRAVVQIFCLGGASGNVPDKVLTNYVGGMSWEQDVIASDSDLTHERLIGHYVFTHITMARYYTITGNDDPEYDGVYSLTGINVGPETAGLLYSGPVYDLYIKMTITSQTSERVMRIQTKDGVIMADTVTTDTPQHSEASNPQPDLLFAWCTWEKGAVRVYGRVLTDLSTLSGYTISQLPSDDIIETNLNYHYAATASSSSGGLFPASAIRFSTEVQDAPTEYGKNAIGKYFVKPEVSVTTEYYPIARTLWSPLSVWLKSGLSDITRYNALNQDYTLKDAYPIEAFLQTLLIGVAGYQSGGTTPKYRFSLAYSDFFAGNQFDRSGTRLLIAPMSNVKKTWYQNPAQKGTVTLRSVLDMFRDVFHCYWFIDQSRNFHIEHVSYFMKGGTYADTDRAIGANVTNMRAPRNFLPWTYGQETVSFDKPDMPERVETSWGIDQTKPFDGYPVQYSNGYVQKGEVDKISISDFAADVDYITAQAATVGDDGWVLIDANYSGGAYSSAMVFLTTGALSPEFLAQNGRMAFLYTVRKYGLWDMSAPTATMADYTLTAMGTVRAKRQQITFPAVPGMSATSLVRTSVGDGEIDSLSYNLLSESFEADLKLNTDE